MSLAIFNISNSTLNLAISLAIFTLVALWLAMVVYTFLDARRRIDDPFLIGCATVAALFPLVGTAVYAILRPPELLADVHERELEIEAAELRVRHLNAQSCPNCGYPTERNFMRCPNCERRLKDPCASCARPVDPRWSICPYCETALPGRKREARRSARPKGESTGRGKSEKAQRATPDKAERTKPKRSPATKQSAKASPDGSAKSAKGARSTAKPRTRKASDGEAAPEGPERGRPSRASRDR